MGTTQFDETLEGLADRERLTALAVGVVFERVRSLSADDRNDLFELLQCLPDANDPEEIHDIQQTMLEILSRSPSSSRPMTSDRHAPMPQGLKSWSERVGGRIRTLREGAGMTQTALAEKAGLTQSHVSRLEKAEHSAAHKTLEKIAAALGVEIGEIDPGAD